MAQVTIYMDDKTAKRIQKEANAEHSSVSKWVKSKILQFFQKEWSEDFKKTLGSLKETDFQEPAELSLNNDIPREKL